MVWGPNLFFLFFLFINSHVVAGKEQETNGGTVSRDVEEETNAMKAETIGKNRKQFPLTLDCLYVIVLILFFFGPQVMTAEESPPRLSMNQVYTSN